MRNGFVRHFIAAAAAFALISTAGAVHAAQGDCSQPSSSGDGPVASDCLFILNAAVGAATCTPECICAPKGSLPIAATDALVCLNSAVGTPVSLDCPCDPETTTTSTLLTTTTSIVTTTTLAPTTTLPPTTTTSSLPPTTTSSTTTTTLGGGGACPDILETVLYAGAGRECTTDADCPVGTCDPSLSRCVTPTRLDTGWQGIAHGSDINDESPLFANIECGPDSAPCGVCNITGVRSEARNCRCINDNQAVCDEPFANDADDCGGALCSCYLGAPLPLSAGNTPACVVNRFATDINGTIDVDSGGGSTNVDLRAIVYLGIDNFQPCPSCVGDVTPNDGVRDGTCDEGENIGTPCDVDAVSTTFPAPEGGGHSLDCFPAIGKNVSGANGLQIQLAQSTDSQSLADNVPCDHPVLDWSCHCGTCSGNSAVTCTSDADCAPDLGTCTTNINATRPTGCNLNLFENCIDQGDGNGLCDTATKPADTFCDGITRASGDGFVQCFSNADCDPASIGVDAGFCTLSAARPCFLPTIEVSGVADPDAPVGAALFCVPATSNGAINSVAGLPGPARIANQATTRKFCGDLVTEYVPGAGCPAP